MGHIDQATRTWSKSLLAAGMVGCALLCSPAQAATVLTFEGLQDLEDVANFYNGGTGSAGSSGPNYGISFATNTAIAVIDNGAGGSGIMENMPSGVTAMFLWDNPITMNVTTGFTGSLGFYYAAPNFGGDVTIYDGADGTGTILASMSLGTTPAGSDANNLFDFGATPNPINLIFAGTAYSVVFSGTFTEIGFDDITLDAILPPITRAPEPASAALLTAGLLGFGLIRRRR